MKNKYLSPLRTVFTTLCLYAFSQSFAYASPASEYTLSDRQKYRQAYNFLINYVVKEIVKVEGRLFIDSLMPEDQKKKPKRGQVARMVLDGLDEFFREQTARNQPSVQSSRASAQPYGKQSFVQTTEDAEQLRKHNHYTLKLLNELHSKYDDKQKDEKYNELKFITGSFMASASKPYVLDEKKVLAQRDAMIKDAEASNPLFGEAREDVRTLDNALVKAIRPGRSDNPENVKRVESIVSSDKWDYLFPERNKKYTYLSFLRGVGKYPALCQNYGDERNSLIICTRALTTMFAHFAQETGGHIPNYKYPEWRQGLVYLREIGWTEKSENGYGVCSPDTWQAKAYPCGKFPDGHYKSYFGRGAKQLSYNYNYGPFSLSVYGDVDKLLNSPEKVADTWLNLASAAFFYTFPAPPKPNMLSVMDGRWMPNSFDQAANRTPGFGVTTMIINGGVECGGQEESAQSKNRIEYYKAFAKYFKYQIPADERLGCANMQQFDANSSAAIDIYWDQDYTWNSSNPGGLSFRCKLVNYQTPFNAFRDGDYIKCLKDHFNVVIKNDSGHISPTADAGGNRSIMAPGIGHVIVELDGRGSKANEGNKIRIWEWSQIGAGQKLDLTNQYNSVATVSISPMPADVSQNFTFQLEITDDTGGRAVDTMNLQVTPYVHGVPIEVRLDSINPAAPKEEVIVAAKISDDDSGKKLNYQWCSSSSIVLKPSSDKTFATFTAPDTTVTVDVNVSLTVTDDQGNTGSASKTIEVKPTGGHYPPWKEGTHYYGGSRVSNNGVDYECKPFPYSGWCGQSASHYKPGEGSHWQDAWKVIKE